MQNDNNPAIISRVKCSSCSGILDGFIYLCNTGHSVCSTCKNKLVICLQCNDSITNIRNHVLESLIPLFKFPCPYSDDGCCRILDEQNMREHKQRCIYRPYKCFFCEENGGWIGPIAKFKDHLQTSHQKYWLNYSWKSLFQFDWYKNVEGYCLVGENIFYFHQYWSYANGEVYYDMKHINYGDNAKSYKYEIEILGDHRQIRVNDRCMEDESVTRVNNEQGSCLKLPRSMNDVKSRARVIIMENHQIV